MASARAQNIPPRVAIARLSTGSAPLTRSFLRIDRGSGDVVLSALKQAEDRPTTIVRLFNPADEPADVIVRTDSPIAEAFAVNFLEERQQPLKVDDGGVALRLGPKQIRTIEIA
jgi:alpha-mannosidase